MMRMDDVGADQGCRQAWRQGVRGVAMEEGERAQGAHAQAVRLAVVARSRAEGDQLAVDVGGQRTGQLQRIALAAAEQARRSERRWGDVNDAHVGRRLADAG